MKTMKCPKCQGLGGYPKCPTCQNKLVVNDEANDRLALTPCSLLRAWKIEPAGNHGIDTMYVLHDEKRPWSDVMNHAEYSLEQQTESDGSGNLERPWNEMKVTITGVLLTTEEWEEISANEF